MSVARDNVFAVVSCPQQSMSLNDGEAARREQRRHNAISEELLKHPSQTMPLPWSPPRATPPSFLSPRRAASVFDTDNSEYTLLLKKMRHLLDPDPTAVSPYRQRGRQLSASPSAACGHQWDTLQCMSVAAGALTASKTAMVECCNLLHDELQRTLASSSARRSAKKATVGNQMSVASVGQKLSSAVEQLGSHIGAKYRSSVSPGELFGGANWAEQLVERAISHRIPITSPSSLRSPVQKVENVLAFEKNCADRSCHGSAFAANQVALSLLLAVHERCVSL